MFPVDNIPFLCCLLANVGLNQIAGHGFQTPTALQPDFYGYSEPGPQPG